MSEFEERIDFSAHGRSESWPKDEQPIVFSAKRGAEGLHVRVIGGMEHPSGNPQLMAVVLEVRLGPDLAAHTRDHTDPPEPA